MGGWLFFLVAVDAVSVFLSVRVCDDLRSGTHQREVQREKQSKRKRENCQGIQFAHPKQNKTIIAVSKQRKELGEVQNKK